MDFCKPLLRNSLWLHFYSIILEEDYPNVTSPLFQKMTSAFGSFFVINQSRSFCFGNNLEESSTKQLRHICSPNSIKLRMMFHKITLMSMVTVISICSASPCLISLVFEHDMNVVLFRQTNHIDQCEVNFIFVLLIVFNFIFWYL